jgi:hypothetical protein
MVAPSYRAVCERVRLLSRQSLSLPHTYFNCLFHVPDTSISHHRREIGIDLLVHHTVYSFVWQEGTVTVIRYRSCFYLAHQQ